MPAKKVTKENTMDKSTLRDLHSFVKDTQATAIMESLSSTGAAEVITETQVRALILAIQGKTDDCFFRFMEKL
jgi:hypothetical protein